MPEMSPYAMPVFEIAFPPPDVAWSVNEMPTSVKGKIAVSKRRAVWRDVATTITKAHMRHVTKPLPPCTVRVTIPFPVNRRRDPHNYTGTVVKAVIDGLVRAGLWPDDNPNWITVLDPELVVGSTVFVHIAPREDAP